MEEGMIRWLGNIFSHAALENSWPWCFILWGRTEKIYLRTRFIYREANFSSRLGTLLRFGAKQLKVPLTGSQSVQSLSRVQLFATPWTAAHQPSLSITNLQSLLKLMSIELVMPSNQLILCHPLLSCLQSFPTSGSFPKESVLHIRWPKYWSFGFSISPFNEHPGLISFRMDWLDLFAVQGTLNNLLQHHSSKASVLRNSAFFMVQLSHPYVTPGKTITLTRWTFVGKIMSLLFNMLSTLP